MRQWGVGWEVKCGVQRPRDLHAWRGNAVGRLAGRQHYRGRQPCAAAGRETGGWAAAGQGAAAPGCAPHSTSSTPLRSFGWSSTCQIGPGVSKHWQVRQGEPRGGQVRATRAAWRGPPTLNARIQNALINDEVGARAAGRASARAWRRQGPPPWAQAGGAAALPAGAAPTWYSRASSLLTLPVKKAA